jgi:hypothetical protein
MVSTSFEASNAQTNGKNNKLFIELGTALHLPVYPLKGDWIYKLDYDQFPIPGLGNLTRRLDLNTGVSYFFFKNNLDIANYSRIGYTYLIGDKDDFQPRIFPVFNKRYLAFDNTIAVNKYFSTKKKPRFFYTGASFSWHNIGRYYFATPNRLLPRDQWTFVIHSLEHNSFAGQIGFELGKKKWNNDLYLEFRTEYLYNYADAAMIIKTDYLRWGIRLYKKLEIKLVK